MAVLTINDFVYFRKLTELKDKPKKVCREKRKVCDFNQTLPLIHFISVHFYKDKEQNGETPKS